MDNYFCSIPLFRDLVSKGIYATRFTQRDLCNGIYTMGMVRSNPIGLSFHLKDTRTWRRCAQGHIEWAIHESRTISFVMWKDKCPVLLISTHAKPIGFLCMPRD
jgi:hypothetical protein